jgi:hypothetical protein
LKLKKLIDISYLSPNIKKYWASCSLTYLICVQISSNVKQGSTNIIQERKKYGFDKLYLFAEDLFGLFLCQDPLPLEGLALPELLKPL